MIDDWGKNFADAAIAEYDMRFPNSKEIKNHTDHNRGIRDYVNRGYICQGKTKKQKSNLPPKPNKKDCMKPHEIRELRENLFPKEARDGKGMQPIGDIIADNDCYC